MRTRFDYLLWASRKFLLGDHNAHDCPACGNATTRLVSRKYLVTHLRECTKCLIRFRVPKDDAASAREFYATEAYEQGLTTYLPSATELQEMLARRFVGMENDFSERIEIVRAAGLAPGQRILDFGGSWGYASWQFRQAGFEVFTYEIGQERARFAREKLSCNTVDDLRALYGSIDCFFSSHVIEHLPNPGLMFEEAARLLRSGGMFVCFCPNGATDYERVQPHLYHLTWGMVHPLLITPAFMKKELLRRGFATCNVFSTPIEPATVRERRDSALGGEELAVVGYWP